MNQCAEIGRMLNGMINKADRFCQPHINQIKESSPEYFVTYKEPDPE